MEKQTTTIAMILINSKGRHRQTKRQAKQRDLEPTQFLTMRTDYTNYVLKI